MKIIAYRKSEDIDVEFQDSYKAVKNTTYVNFKRGQVKNPYDKTACGVGYVGEVGGNVYDCEYWMAILIKE